MLNIILIAVIAALVACACLYIVRAKRRGEKCIGCKGCSCDCGCSENIDPQANCPLAEELEQLKKDHPFQTIS